MVERKMVGRRETAGTIAREGAGGRRCVLGRHVKAEGANGGRPVLVEEGAMDARMRGVVWYPTVGEEGLPVLVEEFFF